MAPQTWYFSGPTSDEFGGQPFLQRSPYSWCTVSASPMRCAAPSWAARRLSQTGVQVRRLWMDRAGFWQWGYSQLILHCITLYTGIPKIRSSPSAERPRNALCQLISCQMLHSCTKKYTWKGLQKVNDLEGYSSSSELPLFDGPYITSY